MPHSEQSAREVVSTGRLAVIVAVTLAVLKAWAYAETDSAAILSSLLDSVGDVLVSLMTWASLIYAVRPADEDHRYGHGKMEGLSALGQAVLLGLGGVFLAYEGVQRLIMPTPLTTPIVGVGVLVFSIIASYLLVRVQTKTVEQHKSLAVEADRGHYTGDMITNAGALGVLILVPITGWAWLDPLFAVAMAIVMIRLTYIIGTSAIDMLLDREVDVETKHRFAHLILQDRRILRLHDLRVIRHGMRMIATYDIELDGAITLNMAHDIAVQSETRILAEFPEAEIMIHMDPEGVEHHTRHHVIDVISARDVE